jgi:hypothetical protein
VTTDGEAARASLWRRTVSALHGEVSAEQLEAFRRAGSGAYDLYLEADKARSQLALEGVQPWNGSVTTRYQLLCTWNAHVLQSLATTLLDADYSAMPSTRGFVPPVTADQAWAWFEPVQYWLDAGRQAALGAATRHPSLPADLPAWIVVEPCPRPHLRAMLTVAQHLEELLEASLASVSNAPCGDVDQARLRKIQQAAASARSAIQYSQGLLHSRADNRLHELIEQRLHLALELQFHLGQLLADPTLIDGFHQDIPAPVPPVSGSDDPWCLTDPRSRIRWQADPRAHNAVTMMWHDDPDPALTRSVAGQIAAAFAAGQIVYATDDRGQAFGNYYCCPWSAIYEVRSEIRVLGQRLRPGQQFTVDVSAEQVAETGEFVRRIITGPFSPATSVDYCDNS